MPYDNLHAFKNKRVLLLQGPVGPFFKRFSQDLKQLNSIIHKINFNGGDDFFYPNGVRYTGKESDLEKFLKKYTQDHQIDMMVMFGDCRPIHVIAKKVAQQNQIEVFVFEEGYLRPNHITLESQGVNGYSPLPKDARDYLLSHLQEDIAESKVMNVGSTFWYATLWAIIYYVASNMQQSRYPHYKHHRPLTIKEALPWIRGTIRKWRFKLKERGIEKKLTQSMSDQYFLVPLQVHNDFQVTEHSNFGTVEHFINTTLLSFAQYAPKDTSLVLKQHPFDRGYNDYTQLIKNLAESLGILERVIYIHDQYLPHLIEHARGVIVINSTVGLSAVSQLRPVKVCGEAIYNIPYLTAQVSLDEFWEKAQDLHPDEAHVHQYIHYLSKHTQHNGSFYRRIKNCQHSTGVMWTE